MSEQRQAERLERLVRDLLAGRHLKATPADAPGREAILAAARLAAARERYPRMTPSFRRRLAGIVESGEAPSWVSRRAALLAGVGIAAGALGGAGLAKLGEVRPRTLPQPAHGRAVAPGTGTTVIDPRPGRWTDVAAMSDLPEGQGVHVSAGAVRAFLFRQGEKVTGLSAVCTHLPCDLKWMPGRGVMLCPCHNQSFDVAGQSTSETYPLPALPKVQVRVQDGRIQVLGT